MDRPSPAPHRPAHPCARCGSAVGSAFWKAGVCLRCAGARILMPDLGGAGQELGFTPGGPGLADSVSIPERIGQYEIIEELGRGGMGRVYAARQGELGRVVALKVMSGTALGLDFELRFMREAQTAARLRHPNLVAVHDFGRADGQLFFSMDYIEGGDLAQRLRGKPFAPWEAASVLRKVTLALAHAHAEGVLHRDLKPSNILLDGGEPKLADFGLAAQLEAGGDLTAATGILGTPHYLAPEALRQGSAALTVSSDLYGLGVVLFELLTGRTPFAGASPGALLALVESAGPPSPRLLAPAVPRDLETICLKCLDREPARRYASAEALAEDLRRFLDGESILARPLSGPARFVRWCRRRPALAAVWVLVTTLAVGSSIAAVVIDRTLNRAVKAEGRSQERLRDARLAEARLLMRTTEPGRRDKAVAALREAAKIRPGDDLQDEFVASLFIPDIKEIDAWQIPGVFSKIASDPQTRFVSVSPSSEIGQTHVGLQLYQWGAKEPFSVALPAAIEQIGQARFSQDGQYVMARVGGDELRVWRVSETNPLVTLKHRPNPGGNVHTISFNDDYDFSPDGKHFVLGLPDRGISLHRMPDGAEERRWESPELISRVRFSPSGQYLAAFNSLRNDVEAIYILDTSAMSEVRRITLAEPPNSVAWSPDGQQFATSLTGDRILIYDTTNWRQLSALHSPVRDPNELVFLGGSSLLAVRGFGSTLHLLNALSGVDEIALDGFGTSGLMPAPQGDRFTAAMKNGKLVRWGVQETAGLRILPPPKTSGYEQAFNNCCIGFSPDGKWVVSSHGKYTVLRETDGGRLLSELVDPFGAGLEYATVAFDEKGTGVYRHSNFTGLRWYPVAVGTNGLPTFGSPVQLSEEPQFLMTDHAPGGKILALVASDGHSVKVVRPTASGVELLGQVKTIGAYSAALSPDALQVLVNCGGTGPEAAKEVLGVYRVADGSLVKQLDEAAFGEAAWSADGATAMTSNSIDRSVIWDTASWKARAVLKAPLGGNSSTFALSPEGKFVVVVEDNYISLVSATEGAKRLAFTAPQSCGMASSVRFLPQGKGVAVLWRDGRLDIFDPVVLESELKKLAQTP